MKLSHDFLEFVIFFVVEGCNVFGDDCDFDPVGNFG